MPGVWRTPSARASAPGVAGRRARHGRRPRLGALDREKRIGGGGLLSVVQWSFWEQGTATVKQLNPSFLEAEKTDLLVYEASA